MAKNMKIIHSNVPIKHVWELEEVPVAHKEWNKGSGMGSVLVQVGKEE